MGSFNYTPVRNGEGIDSFTYSHSVGNYQYEFEHGRSCDDGEYDFPCTYNHGTTSNTAEIIIEVGKAVRADIDIDLPEFNPDATQTVSTWHIYDTFSDAIDYKPAFLKVNNDDDNSNLAEDRKELKGPVQGENDLVPVRLGYWLRDDAKITDFKASLSLFSSYSNDYRNTIRIWDSPEKTKEIFPFEMFKGGTEWILDKMPEKVWVEGLKSGEVSLSLHIDTYAQDSLFTGKVHPDNFHTTSVSDSDQVKFAVFDFDLDIDSDNDGILASSDWEEKLEDNPYGLGKLIMQKDFTTSFTPLLIKVPDIPGTNPILRFNYEYSATAGDIIIWQKPKFYSRINKGLSEGGDRILEDAEYTLDQFDIENNEIIVYVEGIRATGLKTLEHVDLYGKPEDYITATLIDPNTGEDFITDEVKYIVTTPNDFFYALQTRQEVRSGLASRSVYERDNLPQFSLEMLSREQLRDDLDVTNSIQKLLGKNNGVPGFKAVVYKDYITGGDHQYVLTFAGTDDIPDWIENAIQGIGLSSEQYIAAMEIAVALMESPAVQEGGLFTTGHSLGGGLASAAAVAAGIHADTFNSAGLHPATLDEDAFPGALARYEYYQNNSSQTCIDAFYVDWDLLSYVQDHAYLSLLPTALGNRIEMDGPYDAEIALLNGVSIVSGGLLAWLSGGGVVIYLGDSHVRLTYMWSLLGGELAGYTRPLDIL